MTDTPDKMVRYQYMVLVNDCPVQHGPFDPTSAYHPRSAAAIYQKINPGALVVIQYRDNEGDEGWTDKEPRGPGVTRTYTVSVTWTGDDVAIADRIFTEYLMWSEAPFQTDYAPSEAGERDDGYSGPFATNVMVIANESNDSGVDSTESVD